jgi:SPP1 family predicted phage head-tail adaptor
MSGAGARDRRIVIQSLTPTTTDGGEVTETAVTVCTIWAQIAPLTAREAWVAQQSQATTTHKIKILYRPGITHEMQATYAGRTFRFDSVVNLDEANRHLLITATEVM